VTPPITFNGNQLVINYIGWPAHHGSVKVEMQDGDGNPLDGFSLADCVEMRGDEIEKQVTWKTGAVPEQYAGQPVRLRFALKHADLFSFQFKK